MQYLYWTWWLFWVGLPGCIAYPLPLLNHADVQNVQPPIQWENYWIHYSITFLSAIVVVVTLMGCLCCYRHRQHKGFQDKAEECKQEFKDGSSIGYESRPTHSTDNFELGVPQPLTVTDPVQFEPLPVELIIAGRKASSPCKPLPMSTSFYEERDAESNTLQDVCQEWFNTKDLHVPREKLKYLREIGRGWFGKVVEGQADLEKFRDSSKNSGVIVRILTEDATTKEKTWFLGEATPYLKLRHKNILALCGFCLETDPYLLLFESCPKGDVKEFLLSNHDKKSQETLKKENIPTRMALDVAAGLKYMHNHGFVHIDLSTRNCLVASDLSIKLGDYGTAVEKYPEDYYVLGDRALPIRWSAPESIECTDTTIETREITAQANIWSYAILLWEIVTWGERPYNDMTDEQVIQMLLSLQSDPLHDLKVLLMSLEDCSTNIHRVLQFCMNVDYNKRPNLTTIQEVLLNTYVESSRFDQNWINAEPNVFKHTRSASLQDLRGSIDSDYWTTIVEDTPQQLRSSFKLGLEEEPVKNVPIVKCPIVQQESGSETEEESWKGRIEQGVYTEKVKQKSKSVTDLMVLVHIDLDSDAEVSMGGQVSEKYIKKKFPTTGSDSDLRHNNHAQEFNEALRLLRDPLPNNTSSKIKLLENTERPKLLTLTVDQTHRPILRLSLENNENPLETNSTPTENLHVDPVYGEKHVLRLLSKGDPNLPLLRYVPDTSVDTLKLDNEFTSEVSSSENTKAIDALHQFFTTSSNTEKNILARNEEFCNHSSSLTSKETHDTVNSEIGENSEASNEHQIAKDSRELAISNNSTLNSHENYMEPSVYTNQEVFDNSEDLCGERKCLPMEEEEERKQLSTPDDEQSSDSGFRDKESCEEEENVCVNAVPTLSNNYSAMCTPASSEEDQLQILFELDTILDAEYYGTLPESMPSMQNSLSPNVTENTVPDLKSDIVEGDLDENCVTEVASENEGNSLSPLKCKKVIETSESSICENCNIDYNESEGCIELSTQTSELHENLLQTVNDLEMCNKIESNLQVCNENSEDCEEISEHEEDRHDNDFEDEDSSTMSLRSDNSYMSFGMDEEFVTAIRNELREKLPCAQIPVTEPLETHDDDSLICTDLDTKQWEDEENEETCNQGSGGVGISIRYNAYGSPLSPILEERESTVNSESLITNSRDASIASRDSSEDILLVDTRTNKMILLEGLRDTLQDDDRDTTNGELSEDENMDYTCSIIRSCDDKSHIVIPTGGAPLPSPEEESKWQQLQAPFPLALPLQLQDDLISTNFGTSRGWSSQDEDDDEAEDEDELDEDNSSSSGEFVWKRYDKPREEHIPTKISSNNERITNPDIEEELNEEEEDEQGNEETQQGDQEEEQDDGEEEEEFIPSAWNATLAPHRSALRSPDKTLKSSDQKKSVCFKKQRYHCVYEYPKETTTADSQTVPSSWEPTSYSDWEGINDEPRLDLYPADYSDTNHIGNEEFFISSSNRPFQFPVGDTKYVSQFFPGATSTSTLEEQDEVDCVSVQHVEENNVDLLNDFGNSQQYQLGELRHTRDRLKLNLLSINNEQSGLHVAVKEIENDNDGHEVNETDVAPKPVVDNVICDENQPSVSNAKNSSVLPKVPQEETENIINLGSTTFISAERTQW